MGNFAEIASYLDARDKLRLGEVLCGQMNDTLIFIEEKNGYSVAHIKHEVGSSYRFRNDIYSFRTIYDEYIEAGVKFYYLKGINLRSRKIRLYNAFSEFVKDNNT